MTKAPENGLTRRALTLAAALGFAAFAAPLPGDASAAQPDPTNWPAVLEQARGQTVYWHAWGGSGAVNDFIAWVGGEVAARHDITLRHVRLSETAEAVSRVLAERAAGRDSGGAVDLIWINGENFAAMKAQNLLFGPFATALPNWQLLDPQRNPALVADFTIPTDGFESPWAMAQLVFFYDSARLASPPRSIPALLEWARANPGRFAYPQPPDFLGSTFLKQALIELAPDPALLMQPPTDASYQAATAPLWPYLDALAPLLWRAGRAYPQTGPRLIQMMADGEIDLAFSFNPNEAANAVAAGQLQDSARSYVMQAGSIGNASFVAIPYNANAAAGAMVVADFLLSPAAQARQQDPTILGMGSVLAPNRLPEAARALFAATPRPPASPPPEDLGRVLPEPHPDWMVRLEDDWTRRYGSAR